jgi:uncharacterized tellurite resistance protein B-like protein
MDKLRLFRNLMTMAAIDGKMTQEEVLFLALRCSRWGITDQQFHATLAEIKTEEPKLEIPDDAAQRRELLRDMLRMMAVDGELAEVERRLFAVVSASMAIETAELNALIDSVVKDT